MPLELCDVTLMLAILALCTLKPAIFDLAYYGALAGATMSLLTPNLSEPLLSFITVQYFVNHGLIVAAALYLVWSGPGAAAAGVGRQDDAVGEPLCCLCRRLRLLLQDRLHVPRGEAAGGDAAQFSWTMALVHPGVEPVGLVLFLLLYLPFRQAAALAPDPVAEPNE